MGRIVLLATDCVSTRLIYHALKDKWEVAGVILEERASRMALIRRRAIRLGLLSTVGQVLFQLMVAPILRATSKGVCARIMEEYGYEDGSIPERMIYQVESVNSVKCQDLLEALQPEIVVVNGTRIISSAIIGCVKARFLNIHVGITPKYRGSHGAYWALSNDDPENCGVTVHLVDRGIDTGGILYQARINFTTADNLATYPARQICAGIGLLTRAIADILAGKELIIASLQESRLWHHPTLWGYIWRRLTKGVK